MSAEKDQSGPTPREKEADHPDSESERRLIVTINDEGMKRIDSVVVDLENKGFSVANVMKISGIVTGRYAGNCEDLQQLQGVKSAEESQTRHTL